MRVYTSRVHWPTRRDTFSSDIFYVCVSFYRPARLHAVKTLHTCSCRAVGGLLENQLHVTGWIIQPALRRTHSRGEKSDKRESCLSVSSCADIETETTRFRAPRKVSFVVHCGKNDLVFMNKAAFGFFVIFAEKVDAGWRRSQISSFVMSIGLDYFLIFLSKCHKLFHISRWIKKEKWNILFANILLRKNLAINYFSSVILSLNDAIESLLDHSERERSERWTASYIEYIDSAVLFSVKTCASIFCRIGIRSSFSHTVGNISAALFSRLHSLWYQIVSNWKHKRERARARVRKPGWFARLK